MAIGAITMILANVGLQVYNNWCGSRQNAELQRKREEFERAARERNTEHMWRLLREGQELTMQLEEERHHHRLDELKNEIDNLLEKLTYETAISNWPLKVLPIVMKNQAFGNLLANQEDNIAMHIIFTRSNYDAFNTFVFPVIEKNLEQYCNEHWSMSSDHPVLFYSGAWKPLTAPTDVQVSSMRTALSNLPTLLITPFFRPNDGKLVFHINLWGVGVSNTNLFSVPEIEPIDFQRSFSNKDDYDNEEGLLEEIIEDLVPYLQCLMGYMTDTYFWSSAGLAPQLPSLIMNGTIDTDGMKYLVNDSCEYYNKLLLTSEQNSKDNPFAKDSILKLYEGIAVLWNEDARDKHLQTSFVNYCNIRASSNYIDIDQAFDNYPFTSDDLSFIKSYLELCNNPDHIRILKGVSERLEYVINEIEDNNSALLAKNDSKELILLADQDNAVACYRLGEMYEYSIGVEYNPDESLKYYCKSEELLFPLAVIRNKLFNHNGDGITETDIDYLHSNNSVQSNLFIAKCLYQGICMEKSIDSAMEVLENLSDSSHPYTFYLAAQIVRDQYGVEQADLLIDLLLKAADMGYVQAQIDLMNIYYEGVYVSENPQLCVEFAQKAALQGHPEALLTLAICLIRGYGTKVNKTKAVDFLKLSAERGNEDAIEILKSMSK